MIESSYIHLPIYMVNNRITHGLVESGHYIGLAVYAR